MIPHRSVLAAQLKGLVAACVVALSAIGIAAAAPRPDDGRLTLEVHKGQVLRLPRPAVAVFVADPAVADVQANSPTLIYVFGRRAGATSLFAVDENEQVMLRREVVVTHHLSGLEQVVREIAPGERINVRSVDGGLILDGVVRDPAKAQALREVAERYLGENETLINRLEVVSPTQVSLRVRVAEVSRDVTKIFGINWESVFTSGNFAFGLATGRPFMTGDGLVQRLADPSAGTAAGLFGSYRSNNVNINGLIDALETEGLINVLAEPNLTALSGETASFLAGGEFPVPIGRDDNEIEIEFKQFGVSLSFTPTVLSAERISLRVRPEVSDLSDKGAIKLADLLIPALSTRRAETTVELGSGQSFAIGGLISNSTRNSLDKVPALGDLPVLGALFRSNGFRRSETELVIIVTPYLVAPVNAARLAVPNDGYAAPSDLERIIEGKIARLAPRPGSPAPAAGRFGRLAGPAGFILD